MFFSLIIDLNWHWKKNYADNVISKSDRVNRRNIRSTRWTTHGKRYGIIYRVNNVNYSCRPQRNKAKSVFTRSGCWSTGVPTTRKFSFGTVDERNDTTTRTDGTSFARFISGMNRGSPTSGHVRLTVRGGGVPVWTARVFRRFRCDRRSIRVITSTDTVTVRYQLRVPGSIGLGALTRTASSRTAEARTLLRTRHTTRFPESRGLPSTTSWRRSHDLTAFRRDSGACPVPVVSTRFLVDVGGSRNP